MTSKKFTMNSSLREILDEVEALEEERMLDLSIRTQQKLLMGLSTVTEIGSKFWNVLDFQLDGFSENMYENIGDYDEVFEELHEKYKDQISIAPEIRLLFMFLGSAIMFHFSKTIFASAKSTVPNFENIMSKHPELRKAYQEAAMREMGNAGRQTNHPSNYNPPPNAGPLGNIGNMFQMFGGNMGNLGNLFNMFTGNNNNAGPQQMPRQSPQQMPRQPPQQMPRPPMPPNMNPNMNPNMRPMNPQMQGCTLICQIKA